MIEVNLGIVMTTLRFLLYVPVLLNVLFGKFLLIFKYTYRMIPKNIFLLHEKLKILKFYNPNFL